MPCLLLLLRARPFLGYAGRSGREGLIDGWMGWGEGVGGTPVGRSVGRSSPRMNMQVDKIGGLK